MSLMAYKLAHMAFRVLLKLARSFAFFTDKGIIKFCLRQLEHIWMHLAEYKKNFHGSELSEMVILVLDTHF